MRPDVTGRQPARIQRDDAIVEPIQTGLTLAHDLRAERPAAVAGNLQVDAADLSQQLLAGDAVAAVTRPATCRIMFLIAQVLGHLLGQRPLEHRLGHLAQQTVRAEQLDPFGLRPGKQLISQRGVDQRRTIRRLTVTLAGHDLSVSHRVVPFRVATTQSQATSLTHPI